MASGVWQEYHEVDLRSAITSLEAADMIASRLLTAPYGMAAHDVQLPARTRLCAWVEQQRLPYSLGFEGEDFFKVLVLHDSLTSSALGAHQSGGTAQIGVTQAHGLQQQYLHPHQLHGVDVCLAVPLLPCPSGSVHRIGGLAHQSPAA